MKKKSKNQPQSTASAKSNSDEPIAVMAEEVRPKGLTVSITLDFGSLLGEAIDKVKKELPVADGTVSGDIRDYEKEKEKPHNVGTLTIKVGEGPRKRNRPA